MQKLSGSQLGNSISRLLRIGDSTVSLGRQKVRTVLEMTVIGSEINDCSSQRRQRCSIDQCVSFSLHDAISSDSTRKTELPDLVNSCRRKVAPPPGHNTTHSGVLINRSGMRNLFDRWKRKFLVELVYLLFATFTSR